MKAGQVENWIEKDKKTKKDVFKLFILNYKFWFYFLKSSNKYRLHNYNFLL